MDAVPAFSWRRVGRAARYEFQLSADARFRSTLASFDSLNTSASVDKTLFDGDYYWRVRAIDVHKKRGALVARPYDSQALVGRAAAARARLRYAKHLPDRAARAVLDAHSARCQVRGHRVR